MVQCVVRHCRLSERFLYAPILPHHILPKNMAYDYLSIAKEHRRIMLSGFVFVPSISAAVLMAGVDFTAPILCLTTLTMCLTILVMLAIVISLALLILSALRLLVLLNCQCLNFLICCLFMLGGLGAVLLLLVTPFLAWRAKRVLKKGGYTVGFFGTDMTGFLR